MNHQVIASSSSSNELRVKTNSNINNISNISSNNSTNSNQNNKIQIKSASTDLVDAVPLASSSAIAMLNQPPPPPTTSITPQQSTSSTSSLSYSKLSTLINNKNPDPINKMQSLTAQIDTLKIQYEKLLNDNHEMKLKFKLLEDIHQDTINEYDKQQLILHQQIDNMSFKCNQNEYNYENLLEKLNSIKNTYDSSVMQMQTLNEQLIKCKETISLKDREITRLKQQLIEQQNQVNSQSPQTPTTPVVQQQATSNESWNKEVRNLDARINDVLGKIKERELLLNNYDEWERKCKEIEKKYELKVNELNELNQKLNESKSENEKLNKQIEEQQNQMELQQQTQSSRKISLHDFDDDLGKVLMSKEEVITQLEKTIEEKDKQIYKLNDDLQQQNVRYQDMLSGECKKQQDTFNQMIDSYKLEFKQKQLEYEKEFSKLNNYIDEQEIKLNELNKHNADLDVKLMNLNEHSKNEIDNLQEEIKTLEFKLAHSQKELIDYKNLLNKFDLNDSSNSGSESGNTTANDSIQNDKIAKMERELVELKNENSYLNEHIYALDEFMRDKETQNEEYELEIKILNEKLNEMKSAAQMPTELNLIDLNKFKFFKLFFNKLNDSNELLNDFCTRLNYLINYLNNKRTTNGDNNMLNSTKNVNFNDDEFILQIFVKQISELSNEPFYKHQQQQQQQVISGATDNVKLMKLRKINLKKFKTYLNELKNTVKEMEKFYLFDINNYNQQILTYITEQIVHKAALNGHLKFACELLRKKCTDSLILIPNVPTISSVGLNVPLSASTTAAATTTTTNVTSATLVNTVAAPLTTPCSSIASTVILAQANNNNNNNEATNLTRDEKICKIASELLLCDEDSLRK